MTVVEMIGEALQQAAYMGWHILWPLILGFALSGVIQAVVSHSQISALLPDDRPRTLLKASLLGAASSSCSYAAVALTRSLFQKGANFTAAIAFGVASTNLVLEIGIVMWLILGWQFTLAEFIGGPILIILVALIFRATLKPRMVEAARAQAQKGLAGKMEGHASMDMSVGGNGSIWQKLRSSEGRTAVSHYFVMDWASVWVDIVVGLVIAGALAAWIPESFWNVLFFTDNETMGFAWGPIIGALIAIASFVCSVGNIPLAAVLWAGGLSFGGVVSFILADLIILPISRIHKKYYGKPMATYLFVVLFVSIVIAGYATELIFAGLGLIPESMQGMGHAIDSIHSGIEWNYTTWLNLAFGALAALLVFRFMRTGGPAMLSMMGNEGSHDHSHHDHHHEDSHDQKN